MVERVSDIRTTGDDLSEGVDRAGSDVGVRMLQQLQRPWDEELLARSAGVLLAAVARQGVKGALQNVRILVVEGCDEIDEGELIRKVIEDRRALPPDDGIRVP